MIIEIGKHAGTVQAMGHAVSLAAGGEAELKRRCLETLSRLNDPPDEVRFRRPWAVPDAPEPEATRAEPPEAPPVMAPLQAPAAPVLPPPRRKHR